MKSSDAKPVASVEPTWSLGEDAAAAACDAAVAHARSLGIRINVAVTDAGGNLMAFRRMHGAFLHSIDIAIDKAYTAASFGFPTSQWASILTSDEALRLGMPHRPRLVVFGGGLPIHANGHLIGGIGATHTRFLCYTHAHRLVWDTPLP